MPKNIVLCSDGTGNSAGKSRGTNVYRLFQAVDIHNSPNERKQVAFYDDGVGTDSFKPLKLLGGAFGFGLFRNVRELYKFLVQNYEPGDSIFLFGFSRGAFTVRLLASMVCHCGLKTTPAAASIRSSPVAPFTVASSGSTARLSPSRPKAHAARGR